MISYHIADLKSSLPLQLPPCFCKAFRNFYFVRLTKEPRLPILFYPLFQLGM